MLVIFKPKIGNLRSFKCTNGETQAENICPQKPLQRKVFGKQLRLT